MIATGSLNELLAAGRSTLDARLFPVAVELLSTALGKRIGIAGDDAKILLIRFAGNEKGVAYQIEQALIQLKSCSVKTSEILESDSQLWQQLAAIPVQEQPSVATRVLPARLKESLSSVRDSLWQAGVADGRVRVMDWSSPQSPFDSSRPALDPLSQRIKQQLDPFNLLRGHDHEHAA